MSDDIIQGAIHHDDMGIRRRRAQIPPANSAPLPKDKAATFDTRGDTIKKLPDVALDLDKLDKVAYLHVLDEGDGVQQGCRLHGGHFVKYFKGALIQKEKLLAFKEVIDSVLPEDIEWHLEDFASSEPIKQLSRWLNSVRQKLETKPTLCIVDHTDHEIPWELVDVQGDKGAYVGNLFITSRWYDVGEAPFDLIRFYNKQAHSHGHLVSFIDKACSKHEKNSLLQFEPHRLDHLNELHDIFKWKSRDVGLVYISTTGVWGNSLNDMAMGKNKGQKYSDLRFKQITRQMNLFEHSFVILFLNASHSGRLRRDRENSLSDRRQGFVQRLMKKGAFGVIGTVGQVSDALSSKFAQQFFHYVYNDSEQIIAEILCQLRTEVTQELRQCDVGSTQYEDAVAKFLTAFKYVYYGHPLTTLSLISPKEGHNES